MHSNQSQAWRLSRIEEEVERIEFSQHREGPGGLHPPKAGTLPRRFGHTDSHGTMDPGFYAGLGYSDDMNMMNTNVSKYHQPSPVYYSATGGSSSTPNLLDNEKDGIYSKPLPDGIRSAELNRSKEAIQHLVGKYDSLGRLKASQQQQSNGLPVPSMPLIEAPHERYYQKYGGNSLPRMSHQRHVMSAVDTATPVGPPSPPPQAVPGHATPPAADAIIAVPSSPPPFPAASLTSEINTGVPITPGPQKFTPASHQTAAKDSTNLVVNSTRGASSQSVSQSPAAHNSNSQSPQETGARLSEHEITQVEMFYRSNKTEVYVCQCLANLYFGSTRNTSSPTRSPAGGEATKWDLYKVGVPVLVLDTGESHRNRKLYMVLAERGTGFYLWKDCMNHLTNFTAPSATFHTLHLSGDHTKLAGFSYDDASAASEFLHKLTTLTSSPNDDILNLSGGKNKKKSKFLKPKSADKKKQRPPVKADISAPCCFTHVTKLDRNDGFNIMDTPTSNTPSSAVAALSPSVRRTHMTS